MRNELTPIEKRLERSIASVSGKSQLSFGCDKVGLHFSGGKE